MKNVKYDLKDKKPGMKNTSANTWLRNAATGICSVNDTGRIRIYIKRKTRDPKIQTMYLYVQQRAFLSRVSKNATCHMLPCFPRPRRKIEAHTHYGLLARLLYADLDWKHKPRHLSGLLELTKQRRVLLTDE